MSNLSELKQDMNRIADPVRAVHSARYFKTNKGEYGYGDTFLGITVPQCREIAKKYYNLTLNDIQEILKSKYHEMRLLASLILVDQYRKGNDSQKLKIYSTYLRNTTWINNWDIIDSSEEHIVGNYLLNRNRAILYKLAKSECLWDKRISIMSTFAFIKNGQFKTTFDIAEILMNDKHDLIHKSVGWMIREVGNRCGRDVEEEWLLQNNRYNKMPRTMLRYAIEKFPEARRKLYLNGYIPTLK